MSKLARFALLALFVLPFAGCPTVEERPDEGSFPGECSDGADNDDDDLFDCADPDCFGAPACLGDDDDTADDDDVAPDDDDAAPDDDDAQPDDDDVVLPDDDDDVLVDLELAFDPADYASLLDLAVRFYGAQRCGDADSWILQDNALGPQCHLEDGPALEAGLDLNGGWNDACDFIKFTLTTAWTTYVLLKAADTFPDAFVDVDDRAYSGSPNGVPDILDEARTGTDYLLAATPDESTVIARVGGDQDHDWWLTSPYQSTLPDWQGGGQRPVTSDAAADIAGTTAAALALMSRVYAPYDAAYADTCLEHAQWAYALGEARQWNTWDNFYPDNTWQDALLCGSTELYRATGEASWLSTAESWDAAMGAHWWVTGWDQHADPCRHSLYVAGSADALTHWTTDVDRYLTSISTDPEVAGIAWFLDWGTLVWALNSAMSAALYHDATGDAAYLEFALGQLEYAMGENGYGRSFVVGWGTNPPEHPHHKNAYGREALDWDLSMDHLYSLEGALVGGPTSDWAGTSAPGYTDDIQDYVGNEVGISYNAGLVATAAAIVHAVGRVE